LLHLSEELLKYIRIASFVQLKYRFPDIWENNVGRISFEAVPGLSSDPPRQREYLGCGRGGENKTTEKIRQIEETTSFTEFKTLNVYQSTSI